ncbi:MAG: kelch repeat-containing protein [Pseudomonadota bacterium]
MRPIRLTRRTAMISASAAFLSACKGPEDIDRDAPTETAPSWTTGPSLPFAVQEIYPTSMASHIHLVGGFISQGGTITGPTNRHVIFDKDTQTWSEGKPLPIALHHPQLIATAPYLWCIGGFASPSEDAVWQMQSGVWRLDTMDDTADWEPTTSLPVPNAESVCEQLIDGAIHIAGGRIPSGSSNAVWSDHIDTNHHFRSTTWDGPWMPAAPLPTPRNSAAAGGLFGNWHVVGGRTVSGGNTAVHEVYDPNEDRWRTAAPMPQAQGGLAATSALSKLYVFGGEFFENDGGVYSESWVYDAKTDAWSTLPDMPNPRHGLGAVSFGNEIYVIGGALKVGGSETSNLVEILTI